MLRSSGGESDFLPGSWTVATLPSAVANLHKFAWVTDLPLGPGIMVSDGAAWDEPSVPVDSYSGTTDVSGNYAVVFPIAYSAVPNVQPVTYPTADATTRVRVTAASVSGFTVRTEKNATVNLLGIDILSLGTIAVAGVPVRVLVAAS